MNVGSIAEPRYVTTANIPWLLQDDVETVFLEYTNFTREEIGLSIDTLIERSCYKFYKVTRTDGRIYAINKDFTRWIAERPGGGSYVYFLHTPERFDIQEEITVIEGRLALCSAAGGSGGGGNYRPYIENDSLKVEEGVGGVPLDDLVEATTYTAGVGIQILGTVISNIGDTNPADDVLKTTNHEGDVTGVYNMLVIGDSVIGFNNLEQVVIDSILAGSVQQLDTFDIASDILRASLSGDDVPAKTVDLSPYLDNTDDQGLTLDSTGTYYELVIEDGDTVRWSKAGTLPAGIEGQTLYWDSTYGAWTVNSNLFSDSSQVSINGIRDSVASLTVWGDTALVVRTDTSESYLRLSRQPTYWLWQAAVEGEDNIFFGLGSPNYRGMALQSETGSVYASFPSTDVGISNSYIHTSGTKSSLTVGYNKWSGSTSTFAPISGSGQYNAILVQGNINQTGSSTGIARGVYVNPTITEAPNYRAFQANNSVGMGFLQSGSSTVTNRFWGKTIIGSTGIPARELHVEGRARITESVGGADGLLGVTLANGDVTHLQLGEGIEIVSDTASATISLVGWTLEVGDTSEVISGGYTLALTGTGGITASFDTSTNTLNIDGTGVGGSGGTGETNEGANLGLGVEVFKNKTDTTLNFRTITADGMIELTEGANEIEIAAFEVDGDTTNEIQLIDTFEISSDFLRLSVTLDDLPFLTVDLSEYRQQHDTFSIISNTLYSSLSDDNVPASSVDLSPYLDNTDDQVIDTMEISSDILYLSLEDDNVPRETVDLSKYRQSADQFAISGDTLYLSLSDDSVGANAVLLAPYLDNTDDQVLDTAFIAGNTLYLSIEDDGLPATEIDLTPYLDNTDTQDLSIDSAGNWYTVSLVDGGSVSFMKGDTDTDNQTVDTFALVGTTLRLALEDDNEAPYEVDLSSLQDGTGTDDQQITPSDDGTSFTWALESSTNGITLTEGSNITMTRSGDDVTISAAGGGSGTGEANVGANLGAGAELYEGKADTTLRFRTLEDGGIVTITQGATDITIEATEVDGSITNEIQTIDTFRIVSDQVELSLSSDGLPAETIDLSPYLDNTDDQVLDTAFIDGNILYLSIEDDGLPAAEIDLTPYLDGGGVGGSGLENRYAIWSTDSTLTYSQVYDSTYATNYDAIYYDLNANDTTDAFLASYNTAQQETVLFNVGAAPGSPLITHDGFTRMYGFQDWNGGVKAAGPGSIGLHGKSNTNPTIFAYGGLDEILFDPDANGVYDVTIDELVTSVEGLNIGTLATGSDRILGITSGGDVADLTVGDGLAISGDSLLVDGGVSGSGTLNYVAKWTPDGNTLGDSQIFDNGTNVGIGTETPTDAQLVIVGDGTTSATYTQKWKDSGGSELGWVRDDGYWKINKNVGIGIDPSTITNYYITLPTTAAIYGAGGGGYLELRKNNNVLRGDSFSWKIGTKLGVGDILQNPDRTLHIHGEVRVDSSVDTATVVNLWAGNAEGDLRKIEIGSGLEIQGDSAIVVTGGGGGGGVGGSGLENRYALWATDTTLTYAQVWDSTYATNYDAIYYDLNANDTTDAFLASYNVAQQETVLFNVGAAPGSPLITHDGFTRMYGFQDWNGGVKAAGDGNIGLHGDSNTNPMIYAHGGVDEIKFDPDADGTYDVTIDAGVTSVEGLNIGTLATGSDRLLGITIGGNVADLTVGDGLTISGDSLQVDGGVSGSGTLDYLALWTPDGTSLGDSKAYQDANNLYVEPNTTTWQFADGFFGATISNTPRLSTIIAAGSPTITWNGDGDTGLGRIGANEIGIYAGTTDARITVDGTDDELRFDPNGDGTDDVTIDASTTSVEGLNIGTLATGSDRILGITSGGDVADLTVGDGLTISGDSLIATGGGGSIGPGTVNYYPIFTATDEIGDGLIWNTLNTIRFDPDDDASDEFYVQGGTTTTVGISGTTGSPRMISGTSTRGYTFSLSTGTGMFYEESTDSLRITGDNANAIRVGTAGTTMDGPVKMTDFTQDPTRLGGLNDDGLTTDVHLSPDGTQVISGDTLYQEPYIHCQMYSDDFDLDTLVIAAGGVDTVEFDIGGMTQNMITYSDGDGISLAAVDLPHPWDVVGGVYRFGVTWDLNLLTSTSPEGEAGMTFSDSGIIQSRSLREFDAGSGSYISLARSCITNQVDGGKFKLLIKNTTGTSQTYIIKSASLTIWSVGKQTGT